MLAFSKILLFCTCISAELFVVGGRIENLMKNSENKKKFNDYFIKRKKISYFSNEECEDFAKDKINFLIINEKNEKIPVVMTLNLRCYKTDSKNLISLFYLNDNKALISDEEFEAYSGGDEVKSFFGKNFNVLLYHLRRKKGQAAISLVLIYNKKTKEIFLSDQFSLASFYGIRKADADNRN